MNKKKTKEEIATILKDRGIELEIGGCGCCGSPFVSIVIDGEKLVNNEEHYNFPGE